MVAKLHPLFTMVYELSQWWKIDISPSLSKIIFFKKIAILSHSPHDFNHDSIVQCFMKVGFDRNGAISSIRHGVHIWEPTSWTQRWYKE